MDPTLLPVGTTDELAEGDMKAIEIDGKRMVLTRTADGFRVFARDCPHDWADLLDGVVSEDRVWCNEHGYEFDLATGKCVTELMSCPDLVVLPTEVRGSEVMVQVQSSQRS